MNDPDPFRPSPALRVAIRALCLLLAVLLLGSLPFPALARTWRVTVDGLGDAPTVQAGMDSAAAGDTVLVGPGTYYEGVTFRGRDVVLRSEFGPEVTVLDGAHLTGETPVVLISGGERRDAVVEGFTIQHGPFGINVWGAEPTIQENIIQDNGDLDGAGIWCTGRVDTPTWYPVIRGNVIRRNRSLGGVGGGIGVFKLTAPEIVDNVIEENETIGDGGGIYWLGRDDGGVIRGNVIRNNRAGDHGGGIHVGADAIAEILYLEISWNVIVNNVAEGREDASHTGGGLRLSRSDAWVHHNTFSGNAGAGVLPGKGGNIAVNSVGSPRLERNIIAFSASGGGVSCTWGATPILLDNLAWGNLGGDGVDDCWNWWQTGGNVVADPEFCDRLGGDYRVSTTSPALLHPSGPVGAYLEAGCQGTPVQRTTWGEIKALYGRE